jgi:lipoprotein-anchoring transpeptidase ErfK/SrfK
VSSPIPARRRRVRLSGGAFGLRRSATVLVVLLLSTVVASAEASAAASSGMSIVATSTVRSVGVFRSPHAKRPFRTFSNPTADGGPLVFLVLRRVAGWTEVRLPVRPNGSVGWVKTHSVSLALDSYRVTVALRGHQIVVWKLNHAILHAPAAVGRSALPTPTGTFFIAELLRQSNPRGAYGPYAFGLSAYSDVLESFGGGPGQIGIHGTNEPSLLGTSASHGCVRVANAVIARLARLLPLGTPVVISR